MNLQGVAEKSAPKLRFYISSTNFHLLANFQVSFINENGSEQRRANSYADQTRTTPGPQGQPATNGSIAGNSSAAAGNTGTANRKPSCDPTTMNGNGPPRLRPPPSGPGQGQRAPSIDTMNRPPGGAPPRTSRTSRTTPIMSPEEMAARGREVEKMQVQQSFQRDCFIIPQESVERFLPDGITVRKFPLYRNLEFARFIKLLNKLTFCVVCVFYNLPNF